MDAEESLPVRASGTPAGMRVDVISREGRLDSTSDGGPVRV
jgi:hypothetical protein